MFKENVYVLVKNQQEYDNVKNAFEKLGYNALWIVTKNMYKYL